jgi:hypothetical protein
LAAWCRDLLAWLEESPFSRQAENRPNNHTTWYDRLAACLSLFLGRIDHAVAQLRKTTPRIAQQIDPDGRMPHEIRRTCSFGYSLMNLRGFVDLAWLGRRIGVDLWSHVTDDGRSIPAGVNFLYQAACSTQPWPYEQIEPIDWRMICPVLQRANLLARDRWPLQAIAHRLPERFQPDLLAMVEPIHPFGQERSPSIV